MNKNEHKEEAKKKSNIVDKIDMDNGNFPYAKDMGRSLAKTTLTGSHRAIIDCILDKTIGWYDPKSEKIQKLKKRKIKELITYKYFECFTGIRRNHISKYIKELIDWKVIKRWGKGQQHIYGFNVNVNQWNKEIFKKSVTRIGDTLKRHKDRGQTVTRVSDALSQGLVTPTGPKTNNDKAFPDPKETILNNLYKEREKKGDIYNLKTEETEETEIFNYWNGLNIVQHKNKTFKLFEKDIKGALKNYSLEEIKNTINNYSLILKAEKYFYSYEHTISSFLEPKNFEKFVNLERAKSNYQVKRLINGIDNEEVEYQRYRPKPTKKETEEERKDRCKRFAKKAENIKKNLESKQEH